MSFSNTWRLLLMLVLPLSVQAESVALYTLNAPPLTSLTPTPSYGLVGDVVMAALERAGAQVELRGEPWARAQKSVSEGRDLLITPLSRTPEREAIFTWIAPIMRMDRAFFSLTQQVNSYAEAKTRYQKIGVGLGSAQHQILINEGFAPEQLSVIKIGESPARMLEMGRIDAWFNGIPESLYIWQQHNRLEQSLLISPPLSTSDLYLACSKHCDTTLVKRLRLAVESLQRDGTAQRLLANPQYGAKPKAVPTE